MLEGGGGRVNVERSVNKGLYDIKLSRVRRRQALGRIAWKRISLERGGHVAYVAWFLPEAFRILFIIPSQSLSKGPSPLFEDQCSLQQNPFNPNH